MRIRYEFIRYIVVLKMIDELRRAKAALCYLTHADWNDCAARYGISKSAMKGVVTRLRQWVRGSLVDALRVTIKVVDDTVPVLVDNYVRLKICRLCGTTLHDNIGGWEQHFEHKQWVVL